MNNENVHRFKIRGKDSNSANFEKLKQIGNLANSINFDQLINELASGEKYITDDEWEAFTRYGQVLKKLASLINRNF